MSNLKNKDYFPHPSNLRNDRRMKRVMKDLPGGVGYGAVVLTMERLRCEHNQRYPLADLDLLADEFGISLAVLQTVISSYNLFSIEKNEQDEVFFSPLLDELLEPYRQKVEHNKIAGLISAKKRKEKQELLLKRLSVDNSTQHMLNTCSTEEKRKEKNRIEKNILNLSIANFSEFRKFIQENYVNKIVCTQPPGFLEHTTISISELGYLHNDYSKKDLSIEDAKEIWKFLFKSQKGD